MTKKSAGRSVKITFIWGILGLAAAFVLSLVGSAVALKTANPLGAIVPIAVACVGLGAFTAAVGGRKTEGSLAAGFAAGGFYLLFLTAASLWGGGGEVSPYLLLAAAVLGTAAGAFLGGRRKVSPHKRIKKLTRA